MSDNKSKPGPPSNTLSDVVVGRTGALKPEDTVQTASDRMRENKQTSLPVTESRRLVGMMDQPHPVQEATRFGHDPSTTTVRESMNQHALYCFEDEDRGHALALMIENDLQILPVVDREMRIVGMVSRSDLGYVVGVL